jgi:hypothetical protein
MSPWPAQHLTYDDLDAFHSGALAHELQLHLETCAMCQELVAADRDVVTALGALPALAPSAGFADRVMARVRVPARARVPLLSFPRVGRARLAWLGGLAAALVGSVAWSAANRPLIEAWLAATAATLERAGWAAVRTLAALVAEQPWFDAVRALGAAPLRLAVVAAAGLLLYATGVIALRRLLTPSAGPASDAAA